MVQRVNYVIEDQDLIKSFFFDNFTTRKNSVPKAHVKAFEWVFGGVSPDREAEIGFPEWLRSGNGIFWIRDKAGSGKSTFDEVREPPFDNPQPLTRLVWAKKVGCCQLLFLELGNRPAEVPGGALVVNSKFICGPGQPVGSRLFQTILLFHRRFGRVLRSKYPKTTRIL
jgi:hypothetical protein